MPKPQKNTPVSHVLSLAVALPAWYAAHADTLKDGLDRALDPAAALAEQYTALVQAQETFEREQKEDVAASIQVDAFITEGIALLGSISKVIQAALRQHPQRDRLTRQIIEAAPSTRRTANVMLAALRLASAGLKQHAALFESRAALHERATARADALIVALDAAQTLRKQERVESRAASVAREAALVETLALVTTLDDSAQAVYFEAPEPYNTLRVLYDIHCPTPPRVSIKAEEDPDNLEEDLT